MAYDSPTFYYLGQVQCDSAKLACPAAIGLWLNPYGFWQLVEEAAREI